MRDLDHEVTAERQPGQLSNRCHGADHRVLVTAEVTVLAKAPDGTISKDRLVQNLQEVDPDQDGQNMLVGLAANSLAL
jgi:hypothetical protein